MTDNSESKSVDDQIVDCLNLKNLKSFFLFAGAGSGKTHSLVTVLKKFQKDNAKELRLNGQRIAVITYTNAARDEIIHRLEYDTIFVVSTIHGFAWELIHPYQKDIRECLRQIIQEDIDKLYIKQNNGRKSSKAWQEREIEINTKNERLNKLNNIKKITYNPNINNILKDSLNHSEIIKITAKLLFTHSLLQKILINTYPILLIDESQDTHKELIDAFFLIQKNFPEKFSLGLFGDMMQRVYTHGKEHLENHIPPNWETPQKIVNHRCSKRIIKLINKIRSEIEEYPHIQIPSENNEEGFVRLFIADMKNIPKKDEFESLIFKKMAEESGDEEWRNSADTVKILTLEHHMAAKRGNFDNFFIPLYSLKKFQTGVLDGTLPEISLFKDKIMPLISAKKMENKFLTCRIAMEFSPLFEERMINKDLNTRDMMRNANDAINKLYALWDNGVDPILLDILNEVNRNNLFEIPDNLKPIIECTDRTYDDSNNIKKEENDSEEIIDAWEEALKSSYSQFESYVNYVSNNSRFGTHQGVKGLEFPRVMVIIDDEEAKGIQFSYGKLFGTKEPSSTDIDNKNEGKDTSIERTCRLFYVTCSRARKSLAIVAYTKEPDKVKEHVLSQGWFEIEEIIESNEIIGN